jgi:hypothetical protein
MRPKTRQPFTDRVQILDRAGGAVGDLAQGEPLALADERRV